MVYGPMWIYVDLCGLCGQDSRTSTVLYQRFYILTEAPNRWLIMDSQIGSILIYIIPKGVSMKVKGVLYAEILKCGKDRNVTLVGVVI